MYCFSRRENPLFVNSLNRTIKKILQKKTAILFNSEVSYESPFVVNEPIRDLLVP